MTGKNQITRVAAYGLIVEGEQILLCRISDQLPRLAGQWTLPGGGLEFREDPVDAMLRDVREETGLVVRAAGLAGVDARAVDAEHALYHAIRIMYHAEPIGGELTYEVAGTTDCCQWWHRSELADLTTVDLVEAGAAHLWSDGL